MNSAYIYLGGRELATEIQVLVEGMEVEGPRRPASFRSRKRARFLRPPLWPRRPPRYLSEDASESEDDRDEIHGQDGDDNVHNDYDSDDGRDHESDGQYHEDGADSGGESGDGRDHEDGVDNGGDEEEEEEEDERGESGSEGEFSDRSDGDGDGDGDGVEDDAAEDLPDERSGDDDDDAFFLEDDAFFLAVEGDDDEEQQDGEEGGDQPSPAAAAVAEDETMDAVDDERPIRVSRNALRWGSAAPARAPAATAPPPPSAMTTMSPSSSESSVIGDVTVENTGRVLDCGICFNPLKPPIFQCDVGHVVCSPCRDRLLPPPPPPAAAGACHVCRGPTGFRRCYAMEQLVDSIRVPCPHAAHGCAARPAYHDRAAHARACAHAPCRCPGGEACGFAAGSTAALVDHLAAAHDWPCTAEPRPGVSFAVDLRDGFNFVTATRYAAAAADDADQTAATATPTPAPATTSQYLFLLNVAPAPPLGRSVTAFCVQRRHPAATAMEAAMVKLTYTRYRPSDVCRSYHQSSEFKVACTDLSDGVPDPSECFQFIVQSAVRGDDDDDDAKTRVMVSISPPLM
ncbi:hypothetical protein ACP4OV_006707 [Aristida adscensionis]